jgi:hypothetical protein
VKQTSTPATEEAEAEADMITPVYFYISKITKMISHTKKRY